MNTDCVDSTDLVYERQQMNSCYSSNSLLFMNTDCVDSTDLVYERQQMNFVLFVKFVVKN